MAVLGWLATVEQVKAALDIKFTARNDAQIKGVLESASRSVEALCHRRFTPWTGTRYKDFPNFQFARSWRLWLEADEVITVATLASGGTTIPATNYILRRSDDIDEPPYTHIEINLGTSSAFKASTSTHQRSVAITGVFGHSADEDPAGTISAAIATTTATTCNCTDSSLIGVGTIIKVDSERMIVTGKSMLATGQSASVLTASVADVSITGVTAGTIAVDEVLLVDSERMLVVDVAGTTLSVKRAHDGTVLAAHAGATAIYALRTLTVQRGALGTTAATHLINAAIVKHVVPGLVNELCVAEAINTMLQRQSGYGRVVGSGENERESSGRGLRSIREDAYTAFGRKGRLVAV